MKYVYRGIRAVLVHSVPVTVWLFCQALLVVWHFSFKQCETYKQFRDEKYINFDRARTWVVVFFFSTIVFAVLACVPLLAMSPVIKHACRMASMGSLVVMVFCIVAAAFD